jgi:hypothetical protein
MALRKFFELIERRFAVIFQRGIQQSLPGHPQPPWSSEVALGLTLFFTN